MATPHDIPPARAARLQRLLRTRSKKKKTSVSISAHLLDAADELAGTAGRSELFERAVRSLVRRAIRRARHTRELAILNDASDRLNAEAADSLEFQAEIDDK